MVIKTWQWLSKRTYVDSTKVKIEYLPFRSYLSRQFVFLYTGTYLKGLSEVPEICILYDAVFWCKIGSINDNYTLFIAYRRGLLLCKDSNTSEWVYIIKTGTCRVLKALHVVKPQIPSPTFSTAKAKNLLSTNFFSGCDQQLSVSSSNIFTLNFLCFGLDHHRIDIIVEMHILRT